MSEPSSAPFAHYLDELRLRAGLSVRGLAVAAGYKNGSSVQRYLEDPTIEEVRPDVARKLAGALFGRGEPPIMAADLGRLVGLDRAEAEKLSPEAVRRIFGVELPETWSASPQLNYGDDGSIPLYGNASASNWMETAPSLNEASEYFDLPFAQFLDIEGIYALKVVGDSVNKVAPDGHYAICLKYGEGNAAPPEGRFVHVERLRAGFVEWTIKQAKWTKGMLSLWPASYESRFQDPLTMGGPDDQVRILGTVVGWVRYG